MLVVKKRPANADLRDMGWVPGSGRLPGGEHGNPLQYSGLENPTDREAWLATVQRVAKSQILFSMHAYMYNWTTLLYICNMENTANYLHFNFLNQSCSGKWDWQVQIAERKTEMHPRPSVNTPSVQNQWRESSLFWWRCGLHDSIISQNWSKLDTSHLCISTYMNYTSI